MGNIYYSGPPGGPEAQIRRWRTSPVVTWVLLAANVLVWLSAERAGGTENPEVLLDFGAMFSPLIAEGQYWRLFTAMFLHADLPHLAVNGLALLIFGQIVERAFGHVRFLIIYILAGLFGGVSSYILNTIAIGAGASGAIFGVLGALAAYFVIQRRTLGSMAWRNLLGVSVLAAISLTYGLLTPRIDNWAHFGGLVAGFALGLTLSPDYRMALSPLGVPTGLVDATSLFKRWWVMPAAAALLFAGAWMDTATLPDNSYSHVQRAESYFQDGDYARALVEADKAIGLEQARARAYYLRALIYLDQGDIQGAVSELTSAIRYGQFADPDTKRKAIRLLVRVRSRL